jgi:hypothetical protein
MPRTRWTQPKAPPLLVAVISALVLLILAPAFVGMAE